MSPREPISTRRALVMVSLVTTAPTLPGSGSYLIGTLTWSSRAALAVHRGWITLCLQYILSNRPVTNKTQSATPLLQPVFPPQLRPNKAQHGLTPNRDGVTNSTL